MHDAQTMEDTPKRTLQESRVGAAASAECKPLVITEHREQEAATACNENKNRTPHNNGTGFFENANRIGGRNVSFAKARCHLGVTSNFGSGRHTNRAAALWDSQCRNSATHNNGATFER